MEESGRLERHGVNRAVVSSDAQHPGWFTLHGAPGGDRTLTPCGIQGAASCRLDEWAWRFALPAGWQTAGEMHAHTMDISKIKPVTKDRQGDRI
jgi:hypothetical protein